MDTSYLPVQWIYREVISDEIAKMTHGQIFYFCKEKTVCSTRGMILKMEEIAGEGLFIHLDTDELIRIDRIITLFGKPGAAYDEYDAYGNACLDCTGGYEKEDPD